MNKRTWHYVMKPASYCMQCDKCKGINIEWSEFEDMIWCYDCGIDTKGFDGIFGGAIPVMASQILGISFNRWNMVEQRIEYPRSINGKILYFPEPPEDESEFFL